jgi:diaminopimelate epimerase
MRFTKGHGTGNDFVIVDGSQELTPQLVAALCHRRFGIGADGVLRVLEADGGFFMDYWNADGSLAEMCGNGVRVFVRYLLENKLVDDDVIPVGTRAGVKTAYVEGGLIRVDMGRPEFLGKSEATVAGVKYVGMAISMGNPHLVCPVKPVDELDLRDPPGYDTTMFPNGVNIEFIEGIGSDNHTKMRVYERGSGETLSCGTGVCAAGYSVLLASLRPTGTITVDVPGGRLTFALDERTSWLTGPAVLVATGDYQLPSAF